MSIYSSSERIFIVTHPSQTRKPGEEENKHHLQVGLDFMTLDGR